MVYEATYSRTSIIQIPLEFLGVRISKIVRITKVPLFLA